MLKNLSKRAVIEKDLDALHEQFGQRLTIYEEAVKAHNMVSIMTELQKLQTFMVSRN